MRVMLLGAGGMLGHDLVATVPAAVTLLPFTRVEMDITDATALAAAVATVRPDVIVNAAAYTAVDRAESERDLAFKVNGKAVGELGKVAARTRVKVVHFSTDYVFDGTATEAYTEDSRPNPINVYGASKLAGERALTESGARYLLIRTSWLFGMHGRSFPRTMWERARAGQATRVVNDQRGRPTYTVDLAVATWRLVALGAEGSYHVANSDTATWYEVACRVFQFADAPDLLSPCATSDYPTPAQRPVQSILDTSSAEALLGAPLPKGGDALERFFHSITAG